MSPELDATYVNLPPAAVTVFDEPVFMVVCPRCRKASKFADVLERDRCGSGCPGEYQVTLVCPYCKLEATL